MFMVHLPPLNVGSEGLFLSAAVAPCPDQCLHTAGASLTSVGPTGILSSTPTPQRVLLAL